MMSTTKCTVFSIPRRLRSRRVSEMCQHLLVQSCRSLLGSRITEYLYSSHCSFFCSKHSHTHYQAGAQKSTQVEFDRRSIASRNPYPSPPSNSLPSRSVPSYTPQQLLSPNAPKKSPQKLFPSRRPTTPYFSIGDKKSQATRSMEEGDSSDRKRLLPSEGLSRNSMLENLHNVERRVEQPQKKVKRMPEDLQNGTRANTSHAHRGNGIIGEYMRPDSESAGNIQPTIPSAVDLTIGK
jgi:hypothetical protein